MTKIKELIQELEHWAPSSQAESFDNVGLLVGDKEAEISGVLVCLDCLEGVVEEAIQKKANVIVAFHPIIFKGLQKITGKNYVERVVIKAIQNHIAIYAMHTNLDNSWTGSNQNIGRVLGLENSRILMPKSQEIEKITFYAPDYDVRKIRIAMFAAGAGKIGNYEECSFSFKGEGTFKGNSHSKPVVGVPHQFEKVSELSVSMIYPKSDRFKILKALKDNHSYEEVAYEIITLENENQQVGMGLIGELPEEMSEEEFLKYVKAKLPTELIRHSNLMDKQIKTVALVGGSGSFGLGVALAQGADAYVSADFKYHEFFQAEGKILITDVGHYECEQFNKNLIAAYIKEKFPIFAVAIAEYNTNPINYFK